MRALDGGLPLVRPAAAEIARSAPHDRSGIAQDEELGEIASSEPFAVPLDDRGHVRRLALDRDLTRPRERRQPRLALEKRHAVGDHLLLAELADDVPREDGFHEEVVFENHLLASVGSQRLENAGGFAEILPAQRQGDGLHIRYRLEMPGIAECSVEAQRRPPVMYDQSDVAGQPESVEPRVEIRRVIAE